MSIVWQINARSCSRGPVNHFLPSLGLIYCPKRATHWSFPDLQELPILQQAYCPETIILITNMVICPGSGFRQNWLAFHSSFTMRLLSSVTSFSHEIMNLSSVYFLENIVVPLLINLVLWHHFISWAPNFVDLRQWTCSLKFEFMDFRFFKYYEGE